MSQAQDATPVTRGELAKLLNDAIANQISRKVPALVTAALAPVLERLEQLQRSHRVIVTTPADRAQALVEVCKRHLFEDAFVVIASELIHDPASIQAMQRLGVYGRLVQLSALVMHWRANPETAAAVEAHAHVPKVPIAQRPEPFNTLTEPIRKGPSND